MSTNVIETRRLPHRNTPGASRDSSVDASTSDNGTRRMASPVVRKPRLGRHPAGAGGGAARVSRSSVR